MKRLLVTPVVALLLAGPSFAADDVGYQGWGPRVGITIDPDQIHFGAHLDFGQFAQHIRLQPNLELGLGSDLTLFAVNFEGSYRFGEKWDAWAPYLGGGLGMNFISRDNPGRGNDSDTDFGLNALGGIEKGLSGGNRFFLEVKLGLIDSPDVKFTVGWTFS